MWFVCLFVVVAIFLFKILGKDQRIITIEVNAQCANTTTTTTKISINTARSLHVLIFELLFYLKYMLLCIFTYFGLFCSQKMYLQMKNWIASMIQTILMKVAENVHLNRETNGRNRFVCARSELIKPLDDIMMSVNGVY